ncbi:hypothetical protein [Pseudomonas veronii]
MSVPVKKRPAPLPDSLTIVLTGPDLAHLDAYRQAEHDVSYPPSKVQQGNRWSAYKAKCKKRSADAVCGLLTALIHQAENSMRSKPD